MNSAYKAEAESFALPLLESILLNAAETTDHGFCYDDDARAELKELSQKIHLPSRHSNNGV